MSHHYFRITTKTSGVVLDALKTHDATVKSEVLATEIRFDAIADAAYSGNAKIEDTELRYWLKIHSA